jgi:hypothetical protein
VDFKFLNFYQMNTKTKIFLGVGVAALAAIAFKEVFKDSDKPSIVKSDGRTLDRPVASIQDAVHSGSTLNFKGGTPRKQIDEKPVPVTYTKRHKEMDVLSATDLF